MIDAILRPLKDRLLTPLVGVVSRFATPNQLSLLAFGVGLGCAASITAESPFLAFGLWLLNRIIDGLDGALARSAGKASDAGGYLDIMLDFTIYAAVPLAMVLPHPHFPLAQAGAVLMAAFYLNATSWMYLSTLLEKRIAYGSPSKAGDRGTCEASTGHAGVAIGSLLGAEKQSSGNADTDYRSGYSLKRMAGQRWQTSTVMPPGLIEGAETILFYSLMILFPQWRVPLFWACAGFTLAGAVQRFWEGWRLLR